MVYIVHVQECSHSHDDATIDVHVCLEVVLPQLLSSTSPFIPGLPLEAFPLMAERPTCRFLKDLRLLVFFPQTEGNAACEPQWGNNPGTRSKRHGDSNRHPRLIPTILRQPSSRRSDRRARIPVPQSDLVKNVYCPAPSRD